ncbi:hypothetical protein E6W39_20305 [Kitasatospora acidiphila]|uniref:Uncharacterized protein n=1 Tax=Kitasatospora acidiphila TaxID=2567942 RepID=A0A540W526_9ACTN|nr:hypothetical protein [Kitasatospora acidiphila]TQF04141.1 hypothetical protein E6W39_20305 [Kitasatospora acidiphila]
MSDAGMSGEVGEESTGNPGESSTPGAERRALRTGAAVAAAVLLGVGIGVGIIKSQYRQAETSTPAVPSAAAPSPGAARPSAPSYGAQSDGTHFGAVRDLLLPVPAGFALGPDDGVYGDDTELTKDQIDGYLDDRVAELPKDQRDKVKAALQAQGHRAAGVRSYRSSDGALVATVWLDRFDKQFDKQAVEAANAFDAAMGSDSGLFRQGPAVPGHQQAACFLPPLRPSNPIDELDCTAGVGDMLVTMHVEGSHRCRRARPCPSSVSSWSGWPSPEQPHDRAAPAP